jgi:hypothetical protein
MMNLTLIVKDVLKLIFNKLDILSQLRLRQTCKYFYQFLLVIDLYNINSKSRHKLTDTIIQQYKSLEQLDLLYNYCVTDLALKDLPIKKLAVTSSNISNDAIKGLTKLKELLAEGPNTMISDEGFVDLDNPEIYNSIADLSCKKLNLTKLYIAFNDKISDLAIENMITLTTLDIRSCDNITDFCLRKLVNLENLYVGETITDSGLKNLSLKSLWLFHNNSITDNAIKRMPLSRLYINGNETITDLGIKDLKLVTLYVSQNKSKITDFGIMKMTSLRYLNVMNNEKITDLGILGMHHLI